MKDLNSKTLNETLDSKIDGDLNERLENLKALWLDVELFWDFQKRIEGILQENPEAWDIVISEVDKATIWVEQMMSDYNDKFRSILIAWSDNEDYIEGNISNEVDVLAQFDKEIASNDDDFGEDLNNAA